jgi:hypothetical protein
MPEQWASERCALRGAPWQLKSKLLLKGIFKI